MKSIFTSSEFIFKSLLNNDNFDNFIKNQINYIIGDINEIINKIHKDNIVEYTKIQAKSYTKALNYIENTKLIE